MTRSATVLERLFALYGEPRTANPDLFIAEFCDAIAGFRDEDIHKAIDEGRTLWTFFPKPSEVIEIVRRQLPRGSSTPQHPVSPPRIANDAERARAKQVFADFMATMKSQGSITTDAQLRERQAFQGVQCAPGEAIRAARGKMAAAGDTNP